MTCAGRTVTTVQTVQTVQLHGMAGSCVQWRSLFSKKHRAGGRNEDYIYLQWHFMTSGTTESPAKSVPARNTAGLAALPPVSKFENIHSWLESLPETVCTEIYCDCCDGRELEQQQQEEEEDVRRERLLRAGSASTLTSSTSSSPSRYSSSLSVRDQHLTEETFYSLQLRQKSRILFNTNSF